MRLGRVEIERRSAGEGPSAAFTEKGRVVMSVALDQYGAYLIERMEAGGLTQCCLEDEATRVN